MASSSSSSPYAPLSSSSSALVESIDELQARLVKSGRLPDILDFVGLAVKALGVKLDLSFAKDLHVMVRQKTCCIDHEYLVKYGVLAEKNASANVKIMLEQYGFTEGVDFTLLNVQDRRVWKKVYKLHPRAFKKCLMRSKNTPIYADYYILLEECIVYYEECQKTLKDRDLAAVKVENMDLRSLIAEMRAESNAHRAEANAHQTENRQQIGSLVTKVDDLKTDLVEVKQQNTTILKETRKVADVSHAALAMLKSEANRSVAVAEERALPPDDPSKSGTFVLMSLGNVTNEYAVMRAQAKSIAGGLRTHRSKNPAMRVLLRFDGVPNPGYLWNRCRSELGDRIKSLTTPVTTFTLEGGLTEAELIDVVQSHHDEPKDIAKLTSKATESWADSRELSVMLAEQTVARTITITTTKTMPIPMTLTDADVDDLLNGLLSEDDAEPGGEGQ
jgi:hypothetical protein